MKHKYRPKSLLGPLIPRLTPSTSFIIPAVLSCSACSPSVRRSYLSLLLVIFSAPPLSFPPLSPDHECGDGLFPLYLVKPWQNMVFAAGPVSSGSSVSNRSFTMTQLINSRRLRSPLHSFRVLRALCFTGSLSG